MAAHNAMIQKTQDEAPLQRVMLLATKRKAEKIAVEQATPKAHDLAAAEAKTASRKS